MLVELVILSCVIWVSTCFLDCGSKCLPIRVDMHASKKTKMPIRGRKPSFGRKIEFQSPGFGLCKFFNVIFKFLS